MSDDTTAHVAAIKNRARKMWEDDGSPQGRLAEYLERARELQAIAQTGLAFEPGEYDADRDDERPKRFEEVLARKRRADRFDLRLRAIDRRDVAEKATWLAMSLAKQGHLDEALQVIGPVVLFHRELAAKNHGDRWQPLELASALYAEALADPKKRAALLREAAALTDGLAAELRPLGDVRRWRERIQKAQQGAG